MPDLWANDTIVVAFEETQNQYSQATDFSKMMKEYGRFFLANKLLDPQKGEIILEIGCAEGFFLRQYHDLIVPVGIDISGKMVRKARNSFENGNFFLSDMENLPFRDGTFDKVVAVYSFIYARDKQKAFREISRVLKTGDSFIIYDPNKLSPRTWIRALQAFRFRITGNIDSPRYLHHEFVAKNALSYRNFKEMGKMNGFVLEDEGGIFSMHLILQSSSFHAILDKLQYKRWGFLPFLKYFSDFFIFRFKKIKPL